MAFDLILVLHDIRSAHNVGSMFRTADGAGVSKVYLSGYTPVPADAGKARLTRAERDLGKTALGAEYSVPWERVTDLTGLVRRLRAEGRSIVALESTRGSVDYRTYLPERDMAVFVGNETEGVDPGVLADSDAVLSIPMCGQKESLNVSVAAGIVLFSLNRYNA